MAMKQPFSITTKPNGKLLVRVVIGYKGKNPIRKSKEFPSGTRSVDIQAWAYSVKASKPYETKKRGPSAVSPDAVISEWLAYKRGTVAPRTYTNYESYTRLYLKGRLTALDRASISDLFASLEKRNGDSLSPKTLETVRVLLKSIVKWALEEKRISAAPAIPPARGSKRLKTIKVLGREQVGTLTNVLSSEGELELETLLSTGLRVSELLALEKKHLRENSVRVEQVLAHRWGSKAVTSPKTASSYRTVSLPVDLYQRLFIHSNRLPDDERFLFSVGQTGLSKRLKRTCARLHLPPCGLHTLRHTHATILLGANVPVVAVAARLGHHSPAFTLRTYAHLLPDMDKSLLSVLENIAEQPPTIRRPD